AEPGPDEGAFVYRYAGREPDGTLTLTPRRSRVAVDGDTAVSLTGNRLAAETRLRPRAEAGEVGALTVFAPAGGGWAWEASAGGGAEVREDPAGPLLSWLPVLGGAPAAGPVGRLWRVTF